MRPRNCKALKAFLFPGRTPHDSKGRNWGRAEGNRQSDTAARHRGSSACDLMDWPNVEVRGVQEGNNGLHHATYPQGGDADSLLLHAMG